MLACSVGLLPITTCLLKLTVHLPCPACGLTRAGLRLLCLDLAGATQMQPLAVPLVLLFFSVIAASPFASDERWTWLVRRSSAAAGLGLVAVWALRFAGFFGGPVP